MNDNKRDYNILASEDFAEYLEALCTLASVYVPEIRRKFAQRAYDKYGDPAIKKLVLAYGREEKRLREDMMRDFTSLAKYNGPESLEASCLNHADEYAAAIALLFDIRD